MKLGTIEPQLRYHAGLIEFTAGDRELAEQHLTIALRGRRALTPIEISRAKATLDTVTRAEN
jgi:hypothetical protein